MDEQRMQEYVRVVQELLGCPEGEEGAVLEGNQTFVDQGLIIMMEEILTTMQQQGKNSQSYRLALLRDQLTQGLDSGLAISTLLDPNIVGCYIEMINKILHCKRGQEGNLIEENQHLINPEFLNFASYVAKNMREQGHSQKSKLLVSAVEHLELLVSGQISWKDLKDQNLFLNLMDLARLPQESQLKNLLKVNLDFVNSRLIKIIEEYLEVFIPRMNSAHQESFLIVLMRLANFLRQEDISIFTDHAITILKLILNCLAKNSVSVSPSLEARFKAELGVFYAESPLNIQTNQRQAIQFYEEAYISLIELKDKESQSDNQTQVEIGMLLMNLGNAYHNLLQGDRNENIKKSIDLHQEALNYIDPKVHPDRYAEICLNLSNSYRSHGNPQASIDQCLKALKITNTFGREKEYVRMYISLAHSYSTLTSGDFHQNHKLSENAYKAALELASSHELGVETVMIMMSLCLLYANPIHKKQHKDIDKAIFYGKQAVNLLNKNQTPILYAEANHNLCIAYSFQNGLSQQQVQLIADQHQDSLDIFIQEGLDHNVRKTARFLGDFYSEYQRWNQAQTHYQTAVDAANTIYAKSLFRSNQEAELKQTADLYRRAAYAHAKTGNLPRALELIEQGRARGLSETLQRDRANLDQIQQQNPDLVERYRTAANTLRNLEAAERNPNPTQTNRDQLRDLATQARADLNTCLTEIRQVPGYETFLTLPTFAALTQSLPITHPLIYLLVTPSGSAALFLHPSSKDEETASESILWLDELNESKLANILNQTWFPAYNNRNSDSQTWHQTIDDTTRQLWDLAMGPVTDYLQTQNITQATLIPTSYLSLLPLHAAWTALPSPHGRGAGGEGQRRYALDHCTYTYAPNARSLSQPSTDSPAVGSLLAIDNPTQDLPNSSQEITTAISHFSQTQHLPTDKATRTAVLTAIPNHTILHFSCHGKAELEDPLESHLLMAEKQRLTLRDFFSLQLQKPRLAILSACETSLPGLDLPDEVISLPVGLLQAGVPAIIASLWSVSDLSTMLLLTRFYQLWRTDNLPPAQALRQAQLWLRDTDTKTKKQHFKHLKTNPKTQDLYRQLLRTDFSHPYHWSAFAYTGT